MILAIPCAAIAAVPISDTVDWIASFPNWNILFSTPDGTPILRILLISSQSGRMVKYFLNWISNCGFLSFTSTVTILNIRASIVAVAEPATPQWNTHTNNRFRIIFRIFEITEISIGKRLFSCALRMHDPSSYNAINGYEIAEKKKYFLAFTITALSTFPKISANIGPLNKRHIPAITADNTNVMKTNCLAASCACSFFPHPR